MIENYSHYGNGTKPINIRAISGKFSALCIRLRHDNTLCPRIPGYGKPPHLVVTWVSCRLTCSLLHRGQESEASATVVYESSVSSAGWRFASSKSATVAASLAVSVPG